MNSNTLTITRAGHNDFTAEIAGLFQTQLCFDEALGVAACFVMETDLKYLRSYADWAHREKLYGGYVEPAGLLPAPEKHNNANLALARQLALESSGVSCPLIRATYIERIAEALGA